MHDEDAEPDEKMFYEIYFNKRTKTVIGGYCILW